MSYMNIVYLLCFVYLIFACSNFVWFIKLHCLGPFTDVGSLLKFTLNKMDQTIFSLVFMTFAFFFWFNYIYHFGSGNINPIFLFIFIFSHIMNVVFFLFCDFFQKILKDKLK